MDDIVTRLRDLREVLMGNPIMARQVQEAMDEIERLRAENIRWKNLTELAYQSWISDSWLEFVEQFDKAVRGD